MLSRLIINKIEEGEETVSMEILFQRNAKDQGVHTSKNGTEEIDNVIYRTPCKTGYLKPNKKDISKLLIDTTTDADALILNINQCITTMETIIVDDSSHIILTEMEDNQQGVCDAFMQSAYNMDTFKGKPKGIDQLCSILRENIESNQMCSQEENKIWTNTKPNAESDDMYNFWNYYLKKINNLNKNIKINRKNLDMLLYNEEYYKLFKFRNTNVVNNMANGDKKMKKLKNTNYVCEFCPTTLTSLKKLLKHQKIHKHEDGYKCIYCNITFDLFKKAFMHWSNECPGIQKVLIASQDFFTCKNCHYIGVNAHIMPNCNTQTDDVEVSKNESSKAIKQVFIALMCKNCGYVSTHDQNTILKNLSESPILCHICGKVNDKLIDCNHDEH
ncbi:uncharacterized protein LOC143916918 [Arctopsyche grandis]|uniref:uncharacterized protein LOC143916918 n=1 Tax=Arctopsyche grandis TaxID=121162 RepID=UPI00406D75E7